MQTTIADVMATHLEVIANQLAHVLPWVKHLGDEERVTLLADLAQACVQVRQTGHPQALLEVLEDWEATAQCLGDTLLTSRLLAPMTEQDAIPWEDLRASVPGHPTP
jgi:hypothetical protein